MSSLYTLNDYDVRLGKPYLTKDILGNYVILQNETLYSENPSIQGHEMIYMTEILIDDNPSEKEIFKYKLKGAVRGNRFTIGRQ